MADYDSLCSMPSCLCTPEWARISIELPISASQLYRTASYMIFACFINMHIDEPDIEDIIVVGEVGDLFAIGRPGGITDILPTQDKC